MISYTQLVDLAAHSFVLLLALLYLERRITRMETKVNYLWTKAGGEEPDRGPFRPASN